jgi:hypothetical protein
MRVKPGVSFFRVGPAVEAALDIADKVYIREVGFEATVTSCRDGNHSLDSLHYYRWWDPRRWPSDPEGSQGAFDLRTWPKPWVPGQMRRATKDRLALEIQTALAEEFPGEFQVVVESDHLHVEHDPRRLR